MSTITITIKEESVFSGTEHGSEFISSVENVTSFFERHMTITQTETTLLSFDAATAGSTFIDDSLKYLRITNSDTSDNVTLRVLGTGKEYFVDIAPQGSFLLFTDNMDANATGSQTASLSNIDEIKAAVDAGATPSKTIDVDIFAAA